MRGFGLARAPQDLMHVPLQQNPIQNAHLTVRTRGNPMLLTLRTE